MDKFTDKANQIIQKLDEARLIYKSDESPVTGEEEEAEETSLTGILPAKSLLNPNEIKAVNVARQLSTGAKKRTFGRDPQKAMDKAYGDLLNKVAGRVTQAANSIR